MMKLQFSNPKAAALLGLLGVLPGALFLPLLMLGIEPPLGPLKQLLSAPPDVPNVAGTLVALALVVGLPAAAGLLNLAPIARGLRAGSGLGAYPLNLLVAVAAVSLLALFAAGVIVDQYPCWIGVPNCD